MTNTPFATGIHQIAIPCRDLPRAVAFYRDVLGLPFLFESNGLAFFMCGTVRLMLSKPEKQEHAVSSILYLGTNDIVGATDALRAKGAKIEAEPHVIARLGKVEVWLSHWIDSEGNLMAYMQEKPSA
jgi:catechol 2,3-dioxygenase-like lactoylglutathione lyase family enzyme